MNIAKLKASTHAQDIPGILATLESQRNSVEPVDLSLPQLVKDRYAMGFDSYLADLGIELDRDTISNINSSTEYKDVRWLVPEVFREAMKAGIRTSPIWNNLTITEQQIKGLNLITPWVNMSDATPRKVGEGETIPLGSMSVGSKRVTIYKIGRGIKVTDEVKQYINLNMVSIFFQDFGVKMGMAMDTLCIDTLLNGDADGDGDSAPVIGVATANTLVYKDLLNIWVRASRMGRNFSTMVSGETIGKDLLDLDEFKIRSTGTTEASLDIKTPVPNKASLYIHGNIPDDQILMVDKGAAVIKYNAQPLKLESEKIISNQTEATYATTTTGFAKAFLDGSVILDKTVAFATDGFPEMLEFDDELNQVIE